MYTYIPFLLNLLHISLPGMQFKKKTKLKMQLPYDTTIPLLGIYQVKMKTPIRKETCTTEFIVAQCTGAKIWKQH